MEVPLRIFVVWCTAFLIGFGATFDMDINSDFRAPCSDKEGCLNYDSSEISATTICTEKDFFYDRVEGMCKRNCTFTEDCEYSAQCLRRGIGEKEGFPVGPGDLKFCRCHPGTSGDRCEILSACEEGSGYCGIDQDVKCIFSSEEKMAKCICTNTTHDFDISDKTCKVCDCGKNSSKCVWDNGVKKCTCDKTFYEKDGKCVDCGCGRQSDGCTFEDGKKICKCQEYFKQNGDVCENCNCRRNMIDCGFVDGKMKCTCKSGYAQKDDICVASCNEYQTCQNGGSCVEGVCQCKNGTGGTFCNLVTTCEYENPCEGDDVRCVYDQENEEAVCQCDNRKYIYVKKEKKCKGICNEEDRKCLNGGTCPSADGSEICKCLNGTSGDLCEQVDECKGKNLREKCGNGENVICALDYEQNKTYCSCDSEGQTYNPATRKCATTCDKTSNICQHKGTCEETEYGGALCKCKDGFRGDLCQIINLCVGSDRLCGMGKDVDCVHDDDTNVTSCSCHSDDKEFDNKMKICRSQCDETEKLCKHGSSCEKSEESSDLKFCQCNKNLKGDFCENVKACSEYFFCGVNHDVECVYNESTPWNAFCKCKDSNKRFDHKMDICRETCDPKNNTCAYESTCEPEKAGEDIGFCRCRRELNGDLCEFVNACENKICGTGTDVDCVFNTTTGKTSCSCLDETKRFDRFGKECRTPCESRHNCSNEANCWEWNLYDEQRDVRPDDLKYCRCQRGTSGDKCEIKDDCVNGKVDCVTDDAECAVNYYGNGYCRCKNSTLEFNGATMECVECNCGPLSHSCYFDKGEKYCSCVDKAYNKDGYCHDCACGDQYDRCSYNAYNEELGCQCAPGFSQNRSTCEPCYCGGHMKGCRFERGKMKCSCEEGYIQKDEFCQPECNNTNPCQNGGVCQEGFCQCKNGTGGIFCQIIEDCSNNEICGREDNVLCLYNVTQEKAYCECNGTDLMFYEKKCIECNCGENGTCSLVNGKKECNCIPMFGDNNGKCEACDCGSKSVGCTFGKNGVTCKCESGYSNKDRSCQECNCGKKGTCSFDNGEKVCHCDRDYGVQNETCVACGCGKNAENCTFDEDTIMCQCKEGFVQHGTTCEVCDCGEYGKCTFDKNGNKTCICDHYFAERNGLCTLVCSRLFTCDNGGTCAEDGDKKFCNCLPRTKGQICEIIEDCDTLFPECKGKHGRCKFNVQEKKAYCDCDENSTYVDSLKRCKRSCTGDSDCENGGTCKMPFCECPEGTSGDLCSTVDGCKDLESTCLETSRKCIYDPTKPTKATCVCKDEDFDFHEQKQVCLSKWCLQNSCDSKADCFFEMSTKTGYCECKDKKQYYNHTAKACEDVDPCLFTPPCGENEVCKNGECVCRESYTNNSNVCKPDFCRVTWCIKDSTCQETDTPGAANCVCRDDSFFDGTSCKYGDCFLPGYWRTCGVSCPRDMTKTEDGCKATDEARKCDKDCGKLGWCIKVNQKEECRCLANFAKMISGKCYYDASVVCASKRLNNESNCECTGIFKQAKNGITCEKRSCSDKDVQEECKKLGAATCKDNWRASGTGPEAGFTCMCGKGYAKDANGICREKCKLENHLSECTSLGQICHLDNLYNANCKCPPSFRWSNETKRCELPDENSFIIPNIPVLKNKYIKENGDVDAVLLNADVVSAMKAVYQENILDYAFLSSFVLSEDVISCNITVQLKGPAKYNSHRFQFYNGLKLNCDSCEELTMLPPLLLSAKSLHQIYPENLDLCSDSIKNILCGEGTKCKDRKCACSKGYRVIGHTLRTTNDYTIMRCEDIDECIEESHPCTANTTCVNTPGDYYCECKSGFKKISEKMPLKNEHNKEDCVDMCNPSPCEKGICNVKDNIFDCSCDLGYSGSLCDQEDVPLKAAGTKAKIIGGVLGAMLGVIVLAFVLYVLKKRKEEYSEDEYVPSARPADNAEMQERRPIRGVANPSYQ